MKFEIWNLEMKFEIWGFLIDILENGDFKFEIIN